MSREAAPPDQLCEELHIAVQRAALRSADSTNALRLAVRRFTFALKEDGASPEAVLIALKKVINSRTFPVADDPERNWNQNDLRQLISTWSIQEFFSEKQA